jgi:hypothetical protein
MAVDDALLIEVRYWRRLHSQPETGDYAFVSDASVSGGGVNLHNTHCDFSDDVLACGIGYRTALARHQLGQAG